MTRATQSETRIKLTLREKIFTGLGLTMVVVSSGIWFFTEALAADFTKPTWAIASPGLTLLTLLVGSFLVLRGTKRLLKFTVSRLDKNLKPFVIYRITRWITIKALLVVLGVIAFFFAGNGSALTRKNSQSSPLSDRRDGAWDVASDHFYDKEPPPPFS